MNSVNFHSFGQQPCKFIGTKENVYIRKEFNYHKMVKPVLRGHPWDPLLCSGLVSKYVTCNDS